MTATDATPVHVPDIGDFTDVPVIEILVSPGDTVQAEDPLVTLESDKATMDVPAPFAGKVTQLQVQVGDRVSEGSALLTLEPAEAGDGGAEGERGDAEGERGDAEGERRDAEGESRPQESPEAQQQEGRPQPEREKPPRQQRSPATTNGSASETAGVPETAPTEGPETAKTDGGGPIYASPSIRRLACELEVNLGSVRGTGRKGRITREDVEGAASGRRDGGAPESAPGQGLGLDLAPWPTVDFEKFGPVQRVERSRIQRISAPNLARNWVMIPHVTQHEETDITDLEAWRKQLNNEQQRAPDGVKVTMVSFLVLACVATLKEFPTFNASLDGEQLVLKRYYNIGFAADTPGGLVVPVIKDADRKGLLELARELGELSDKARAGKLSPGDMQGSTFTISSLGGIGGTAFTPIINAPEVAILGVSRSAIKPAWNGSEFAPRLMLPLSLSYDHRVIDGATAARFVVALANVLTDLRRALL
jgi:pyruvate dehydrogenase E2 component (dihydrolipoamide acetyltransferase)